MGESIIGQLWVISKVSFCVESEPSRKIGPSRQDFETRNSMCNFYKMLDYRLTIIFTAQNKNFKHNSLPQA